MVFESKKILIASAIFNVFMIVCFSCLAVSCSGKYYVFNKKVSEQNKTISDQMNKLTEQNKKIVKIQSVKRDQSKKIDNLQNIVSG